MELTSSDPDVIAPDGTVTQRDTEQQAILTVTVSENGVSAVLDLGGPIAVGPESVYKLKMKKEN